MVGKEAQSSGPLQSSLRGWAFPLQDSGRHRTVQGLGEVTGSDSFFFPAPPHGMWNFPDEGSNPRPLQWKCGILTTGRPGKSHLLFLKDDLRLLTE